MRLSDLYPKLSTKERGDLAAKAGIKPPYLYQIATRWQGRKPSITVMTKLASADRRLKLTDLAAEFGEQPEEKVL